MTMTSGSGGKPRDYSAEFESMLANDPSLLALFDDTFPAAKPLDEDPEMAALLRRSAFLSDFCILYPAVEGAPGYSHRNVLKLAENFDDKVVPTEAAAIGMSDSAVNTFIDQVLRASVELEEAKKLKPQEELDRDRETAKLIFASDVWYHYEEASSWLLRIIDAAINEGRQVSALPRPDLEREVFLSTGRTPAEQESYERVEAEIYARFDILMGEEFAADFPDIADKDELLILMTRWGLYQAIMNYEQDDAHPLTEEARHYLMRLYDKDIYELNVRLANLAGASGVSATQLCERMQRYRAVLTQVASVGIALLTQDDISRLTLEQQELIDDWFSMDEDEE